MNTMIRLATALALVVAACGGGTTENAPPQEEATAGRQEEATAGRQEEPAPPPPGPAGGGFCARAAQVIAVFDEEGGDLEDAVAAIEKMADDAPAEIAGDLRLMAQVWRQIAQGDYSYDEDQLDAAGDRIDTYLASECGIEDDEEQLDEGAGASNTFEMTATGTIEFQHSGEASCSLVSGAFGVEFYSEQDPDLAYDAYAEAEKAVPGVYQGEFGLYTPDEEVAFGDATIAIEEVNDLQDGAVEVIGRIEGGYVGDELGGGQVSGSFRCLISAEEAAGEY